jgi:succinyl-diaminopimelate desuccinylase
MTESMKKMVSLQAISPESGGKGELERAQFLQGLLESWGFQVQRHDFKDKGGNIRPNLVTTHGSAQRRIWIVAHMDTVAPGDLKLWSHDPFDAYVKNGKIYGRGTCDNGQGVISSIYAMRALKESGSEMKYGFGIALVADEEVGSAFGIQKLVGKGIFKRSDMVLVPDFGERDGSVIEVAEKSILWLRINTLGRQSHASIPGAGINAAKHAAAFLVELDRRLHEEYSSSDPLFDPPVSTFEITKREPNVANVNVLPGADVSYIDCRILPSYKPDDVIGKVNAFAREYCSRVKGLSIRAETYNREDAAKSTNSDSEIVVLLKSKIKELRGIDAKTMGIGGGTCAAFFRRVGIDAAVWATLDPMDHKPDEYCVIKSMADDAKVFASLFL